MSARVKIRSVFYEYEYIRIRHTAYSTMGVYFMDDRTSQISWLIMIREENLCFNVSGKAKVSY